MDSSKNEFEEFFREAGIDYSKPGFYDDPNFVAIEKEYPSFLEIYADYINSKNFPSDYLISAKKAALEVVEFVYNKLNIDGLKGVCLDVCGIISRFLERKGVWNYIIKGGLTINFAKSTGLNTSYCAPIMTYDNPAVLGHAWIVAPPFRVIDVAFSHQKYTHGEEKYLQGFIAKEDVKKASLQIEDLIDADAIRLFVQLQGRYPTIKDIGISFPALKSRIKKYGIFKIGLPQATLKYTSCGVTFMDAPLEKVKNIRLSGKYPIELYEEFLTLKRD